MIFALSGLSESGKSTAGRFLDAHGIQRLKITQFMHAVKAADRAEAEAYGTWLDRALQERPGWLYARFTDRLLAYRATVNQAPLSIESLYDPALARHIKQRLGSQFVIIYLEIPREVRLQRQLGRENLSSLEEAARLLDPRDAQKVAWGIDAVRAMTDEVIDNSGPLEALHARLEELLRRRLKE